MRASASASVQVSATPTGVRAHTAQTSQYVPAFDWLRAALACTVMLHHDRVIPWPDAGRFAVQIFFVLSGWLIGRILLTSTPADLPRFYFNRAIRIWVPYYVALTLLLAASLLKDTVGPKWLEFVGYKLLMVWNLFGTPQLADFTSLMPLKGTGNHFWSVNAEEQFYLISPFLLVLVPRWGRSVVLWSLLAALALVTGNVYAGIALGVLAAIVVWKHGPLPSSRLAQAALVVVLLVCAFTLASGGAFLLFAPLFGLAAVLLLAIPGAVSAGAKIAGGMSYPLYLNHWIGVFVGNALFAPLGMRESLSRQVFSAALNVAIAVCLYLYIDRKLLAHRASLFTRLRGIKAVAYAYAMIACGLALGITMGFMPPT